MSRKISALSMTAALVAAVVVVVTQSARADDLVTHHEFQANCSVTTHLPDDPIVFPGLPGASHMHTFLGNQSTKASSTNDSLKAGQTNCRTPDDKSAYWFPSVINGDQIVPPDFPQVIYYKSGILRYQDVVPFPPGIRFVVGSPATTQEQFRTAPGAVEGWECGDSFHNWDIPAYCPPGTQLNIRYQAPSCWNGRDLDSADHRSHMAYPDRATLVCPPSHPVAVPMIEFKMAFPVSGDMSRVRLSSGRGYSWHYDFMNAWDAPTQAALVRHCINGGLQCDPRGFDLYKPNRGAALGPDYRLPR
ncbi:DUF1996 domain-containing protein [Lentzea sp. NEAU-D7]|uniref:DUF1996 domain-containing protein n=1 Tax=Lentzea sp. NEAU-D7 TaxID=2994667 RepID=UPI00224AC558|nr:DUF1996 domain-containing protein [Lentzea sp. NEAU-D7]MCX2948739.1 DUF1996 domain-containing protein [Lentzea sp. NEAU-D7]MCX2951297.1 DUF1996 domain-containing protein [Lentzea sp. NEAU-D7]